MLHGQLRLQTPVPPGDPSAPLSALAQQLGGFNSLDAPPRRVADAYGLGGIGNLKGLQPPGVDIRADLDGKVIRMAGFVTPLAFEGGRIAEFLLVPFVGACIHVPPPPANQIVYVTGVKGYSPSGGLLYPVWVTRRLKAMPIDTALANVGYQIRGPGSRLTRSTRGAKSRFRDRSISRMSKSPSRASTPNPSVTPPKGEQ